MFVRFSWITKRLDIRSNSEFSTSHFIENLEVTHELIKMLLVTVFLLCVQMRSYHRKNLLKNLVFPIDTSAIFEREAPMAL